MSLLENKKNNSGIKQLNQISEYIENKNKNEEEEEEEDDEESYEENEDNNNNEENNNNNNIKILESNK